MGIQYRVMIGCCLSPWELGVQNRVKVQSRVCVRRSVSPRNAVDYHTLFVPLCCLNRLASPVFRDDTDGNPHRAQIYQFELFELILLLKLDKRFTVEQFEATVSQSAVPSPPLLTPTRQASTADTVRESCDDAARPRSGQQCRRMPCATRVARDVD